MYQGAGGGGGYYGGGSGGDFNVNGLTANGGGGGGGGASYASGAATSVSYQFGGVTDANYPGNGVGVGGTSSGTDGGCGAVVILAYQYSSPAVPIIGGALTINSQPSQPIDYWIAAQNHPTSYSVTNLPTGLALNTSTGEITGSPTTVGTFTSTISATNASGTGQATLVWNIDNTPPTVPAGLSVQTGTLGETSFVLTWNAATDAGSGIGMYEIQRDGFSLGVTSATNLTVSGLAASTSYNVCVRASDLVGNWSAWSAPLTVTTLADNNPPSVPMAVLASNITATSLTLNWGVSSDDVGVAAYEVRRNGTSIGTTPFPSMTVSGLSPVTTYSFGVRAGDGAGNWSAWSDASPNAPLSVTSAASGADLLVGNALFTYNGRTAQTYTVPSGASYVVVKAWGAGGGGFKRDTSSQTGGSGGFASAAFNVTPGDQFSVSVATGGIGVTATTAYSATVASQGSGGGGWIGGGSGWAQSWASTGGSGGGGFDSVVTPYGRIWAAGGGGAGTSGAGGAGGGGSGSGTTGGGGATTSSGGVASGGGGINGSAGYGGSGHIAGGGGGGYFGGAGGGWDGYYSGGGGGSSYVSGSAYNVIYQTAGTLPGGAADPSYPGSLVGYGGFAGVAGPNGGSGAVVILAYQTPGPNFTQTFIPTGGNQTFTIPVGADYIIAKAWGAGAGGSSAAGVGGDFVTASYNVSGNQTVTVSAGGGGASGTAGGSTIVALPGGTTLTAAGGASGVTSGIISGSQNPSSSQVLNASGATPPGSADVNYPGNNIGFGGASSAGGGNGAVVLIVHIVSPTITSSLSQSPIQGQTINYSITASNGPTSFSASGLPLGLSLNATTGAITGVITTPGTYNSTITASNRGGSNQATLVWNVSADTVSPSVPSGVQASNISFNSLVLTWSAATDNAGVTAYEVRRDSVSLGTCLGTTSTIAGLSPVTSYAFSVRACDLAGNWSAWSSPMSVQTANIPGSLPPNSTLITFTGQNQTYTVPANTGSVIIRAWGAGGGAGGANIPGGAGAFVTATYSVTPGQTITVAPGNGGSGAGLSGGGPGVGGAATVVTRQGGFTIYAAAGGGGGNAAGGYGGAGGASSGQNGGGSVGGGGGTTSGSGSSTHGTGGAGGSGDGMCEAYDDDGNDLGYQNNCGAGGNGGTNYAGDGGFFGDKGDTGVYYGGFGGAGLGGGGGGGGGSSSRGGSGGGGGSSGIVAGNQTCTASQLIAASGAIAANTMDIAYPGNNVGYGGVNGGDGGNGAVVITACPPAPVINSSLTQSPIQNQSINYAIGALYNPTTFAVSNLPAGLSLNTSTGVISGSIATPGTYSTIISATNSTATGQATLVWTVTADTSAPSVPANLQAGSATSSSFVLSWNASTDNAAVTSYEVQRDGTSLGVGSSTNLTIVGLSTGVTYAMSVRAGDAAGNWSAWSSPLNVTLTSGSSGITSLNYASRTATTVTLMWNPAEANSALGGYRVSRNGQLVGTTMDSAYFDSGLAAGTTYSYTITAVDSMGNLIPGSVSLSVTTTQDFSTDTDHDGVPDAVEALLNTNANAAATPDSTNQLQVNIQRPPK
jgi:chitodextrinase